MRRASRRRRLRLAVSFLVGGLLFANYGDSSTTASAPATPIAAISPVTCTVAPRPFEDMATLNAFDPAEAPPIRPLPEGEQADPATMAAITATFEEMAACLTAGQMLHFYALHSDDWLRRFAAQVEGLTTLTTSTPPLDDGDRAVYLGPWHVQALPDGRVLAATLLRVGDELRPDPSRTRVLVFVEQDGRWLVDETIRVVWVPGCEAPVEAAAVVGPPPGAVFDSWTPSCSAPAG